MTHMPGDLFFADARSRAAQSADPTLPSWLDITIGAHAYYGVRLSDGRTFTSYRLFTTAQMISRQEASDE